MKKQKIVTIGGGSGSFMVLSGLKKYPADLSAIVGMADDGGSTGVLRDELGVLPPGDARQCLIALAKAGPALKELFNYRFDEGGFKGHAFGNLFLAAMEKASGDFNQAVKTAGSVLKVKGRVLPSTLRSVRLVAVLKNNRKIIGENKIYGNTSDLINLKRLYLKPEAELNPEAEAAIKAADKIIINPGDLYCSLIPNFLVKGTAEALAKTKAKIIYVANLITKPGQTDNFTVVDYLRAIEKYSGKGIIDYVIYNKEMPGDDFLKKHLRPGEKLVMAGDIDKFKKIKLLGYNLLSRKVFQAKKGDALSNLRSLIKHDPDKLAKIIYNL
ncbi:YvcK family protein [Candidatus Falkowbacteria bacterium]|nr:YvcK family protein [Candidatus Falkowbacteria bacterium]